MSENQILIVEDEAIVAEDIASRLERMGYKVTDIVASGEEALERLALEADPQLPHLVLMDIMLQGDMDGIQAAAQIRATHHIPIVYLTANADEHTLQRAKITSPFGYVLKPFKEKELRATIEIALARHQAEVSVLQSLEQAKAKQHEAEEQSQLKNYYVSMASHEILTPLAVIQLSTALLQSIGCQMDDHNRDQHLGRIQMAAHEMTQLLDDVLTLGRVDGSQSNARLEPLDLVSLCREVVDSLRWGRSDGPVLAFLSDAASLPIYLDEKLMRHMLNNLLSNAIKYSPEGGTVHLLLTCLDEQVYLQVIDEGIGIPQQDQQQLFEPFYRAANVGDIAGTGLGLAIAKRAVELQDGQITVSSEVGQGTTITVVLPLCRADAVNDVADNDATGHTAINSSQDGAVTEPTGFGQMC